MTSDPFHLARFVEAQEDCIEQVRAELRAGRKRTHWMWFVFPQMRGLGRSAMSEHYGISGRAEAAAYLAHPILGQRLIDCTRLVLAARPHSVKEIFGTPDQLKFHSSMTLFAEAAPDPALFREALAVFFDGVRDEATLRLLERGQALS
jgi:uncharacterized protein (DUF1810 family)